MEVERDIEQVYMFDLSENGIGTEEMVEVEAELENTMMIKVGEEKDINLVVEVQVVRLEMVVLGEVQEDMQQAAYMQE